MSDMDGIHHRTASEMLSEGLVGENVGARKLTFAEKCGAFAALYSGYRNQVVARAFGISVQATSKLSGCLEYDPDPYKREVVEVVDEHHRVELVERVTPHDHNAINNRNPNRHRHYQDVGREFEALGAEEFIRRYYTERIHKRIILAKVQLRDERKK
jgi:hypothetical protein